MFKKIITYLLIISVIVPALAPAGFSGLSMVYAQQQGNNGNNNSNDLEERVDRIEKGLGVVNENKGSKDGEIEDPCGWTMGIAGGTFGKCVSYLFLYVAVHWILPAAVFITNLASSLFNASIEFSLSGEIFDTEKNIMIATGWTMVRDLINLVFIFILLYLAVSMILQYGGASIKKVLPSIIVAAVLVNFSMLITKMVIDASHVFAWEFYNQIDADKGGTVGNIKNDLTINGDFKKKNLGNVFMAAFNPQQMLTGSTDSVEGVIQQAYNEGGGFSESVFTLALPVLLEAALAILAAFVLFAGAIMFVVRVVVLWMVMMFSPIMIIGVVLPSMKKYSSQWWGYLIGQSFFAPAFLFMFVLVTKLINSDFLKSITQTTENSNLKLAFGLNAGSILVPFFHFFVAAGLMLASLMVARQLGGKTASMSIGWAHTARGWAQGAAAGTAKYGWWGAKGGARRWYAPMAENFATGKGFMGKVGNVARYVPFAGDAATRKAADIATESRKIVEEKQKKYGKYTADELKKMQGGWYNRTFRPYETSAMLQESIKKEDIKKMAPGDIEKSKEFLKSLGIKPKDIERQAPFLVKGKADDTEREILLNTYKEENEAKYNEIREKLEKDYVNDPEGLGKAMAAAIKTELGGGFEKFLNEKLSNAYNAENPEGFGKLDKKYAVKDNDYYQALRKELADYRAKAGVVKKASSSDMEKNAYNILTEPSLAKYLNTGSINKIVEMGGDMMERMLDGLTGVAGSYEDTIKSLEELGNYGLAKLIKKGQGARGIKDMLDDYAVRKNRWKGKIIT
ncbi:MAG: hypothetical protein HUT38_00010 [Candidatus Paceibacter sp.]|nr:hypothetical protein [Candidatus Paceibacter sp.]